ncbi:MAG: PQQ-dependent sugar dehydrogenase, partial [Myxococcaceae bacterium]
MRNGLLTATFATLLLSAAHEAEAQTARPPTKQEGNLAPGRGGDSQQSVPRQGAAPPGAPVETAPPNVPEFKPAFPGQTRAPAVKTRTPLVVTEVAAGFNKP